MNGLQWTMVLRWLPVAALLAAAMGCASDLTITVDVTPEGAGTITLVPDQEQYRYNTTVAIEAKNAPGWRFAGWENLTTNRPRCGARRTDIAEDENPLVVNLKHDLHLRARFVAEEQDINASLTVTLAPADALAVGARWRLDNNAWCASGERMDDVPMGVHTLSFYPVPGWIAPVHESLDLQPGDDLALSFVYSPELPGAPEGLEALPGPLDVVLRWREQTLYTVAGYHVYRANAGEKSAARLTDVPLRALRFEDATAVSGALYDYHVTAVTRAGAESAASDTARAMSGQVLFHMPQVAGMPGNIVRMPIAVRNAFGLSGDAMALDILFYDSVTDAPIDLFIPGSLRVVTTAITADVAMQVAPVEVGRVRIEADGNGGSVLTGEGRLLALEGVVAGNVARNDVVYARIENAEVYYDGALLGWDATLGAFVATDACMRGDVDDNDIIEVADADLVLAIAARLEEENECRLSAGDMNVDTRINSADAVIILRVRAGWYQDDPGADGAPTLADLLRPSPTEPGEDIVVSVGGATVDAGDMVEVPVRVTLPEGLHGAEVIVSFPADLELLDLLAVEPNPNLGAESLLVDTSRPGVARILLSRAYEPAAAPVSMLTLAWLRFRIGSGAPQGYRPPITVQAAYFYGAYGELADWYAPVIWEDGDIIVTPTPAPEGEGEHGHEGESEEEGEGEGEDEGEGEGEDGGEGEGEGEEPQGLIITLAGEPLVTLEFGESYVEAGIDSVIDLASRLDIWDNAYAGQVLVTIMNTSEALYQSTLLYVAANFNDFGYNQMPDTYTLAYDYESEPGVSGAAVRTVVVADIPPEGEGEYEVIPGEMIAIPAGTFEMGRPYTDTGREEEVPVHDVYLDAYVIGIYPVTNQEYADVLNWARGRGYLTDSEGGPYNGGLIYAYGQPIAGTESSSEYAQITYNGSMFGVRSREGYGGILYSMADHPMVMVSWYGAVTYCNWLSETQGLQPVYNTTTWERNIPLPNGYRLPTEAEWERAAAWDSASSRHWRYGMSSDAIDSVYANYDNNNPLSLTDFPYTTPVGWYNGVNPARLSAPTTPTINATSPVGAYDMSGSVWEWCHDWWYREYTTDSVSNPTGPALGTSRLLRGGSWNNTDERCRTAARDNGPPDHRGIYGGLGFRISRTP